MNTTTTYQTLQKPASEFSSREAYLEHELVIMNPRRWKLNLPGRDFNFEIEDITPALAGTIGKIVMTTAIVAAFAAAYGLGPEFVVENVRFEMLIAAVLFVILFGCVLDELLACPCAPFFSQIMSKVFPESLGVGREGGSGGNN
ncbi:MAG: DUF3360 family protein [Chloroflexi bacterium]|nr:DUF3360 family protein [Chloroflexota bacterium]